MIVKIKYLHLTESGDPPVTEAENAIRIDGGGDGFLFSIGEMVATDADYCDGTNNIHLSPAKAKEIADYILAELAERANGQ